MQLIKNEAPSGEGARCLIQPDCGVEQRRPGSGFPGRRDRPDVLSVHPLGEVTNLTWSDVDFEKHQLRVVRKTGSESRAAWTPKDKDMRTVPLPKAAVNILAGPQLSANDGQEYVFVISRGPTSGGRVKQSNLWRDFQAIREKAGLPKCSFHDLRKSYCTNLADAVPLHVVQELAGHADIRTTRKHYLKVREEQIGSARRALEEMMRS